ncbi:MAG: squalene synthase HpnC [Pirellulales bacterium]
MPSVMSDLSRYGPDAIATPPTLAEARDYCRRLAATHYENFTVASWLVPRALRPHFHAVYAFCRWADDLADETGSAGESLVLLDWWEKSLAECYRGRPTHPVFVALADTVTTFAIPEEPFRGLLTAFRRDQQQNRYDTFDALRDYCRGSADPVGRLVLYLGRRHDTERGELSDHICTGLQLANFCQDVAGDWDRGRIYLPQQTLRQCGYEEAMFRRREMNEAFRRVMEIEVERAEAYLLAGLPLADRMPRELQVQIELFAHGGLAILSAIRAIGYDVWRVRPTVSRWKKLALLSSCWWRRRRRRARAAADRKAFSRARDRFRADARNAADFREGQRP